jgi:membrane dipeptidase
MKPLIVDAHQDLAYNILTYGRDYTRSALETRRLEAGTPTPQQNGDSLLGWPEYQQARVGVVFATLFAPPRSQGREDWEQISYSTIDEANRLYRAQLDLYHRLVDEHAEKYRLVQSQVDLEAVVKHWGDTSLDEHPIGLVPLMESAEAVREPGELEEWWARGLRIIGLAWGGTRFSGGTRQPGPLTPAGEELLEAMAEVGFILDLSHMDAAAALQALERYPGKIIASHSNALTLLKGSDSNRHLPDEVIQGLLEREGVIGIVPLNSFLLNGWKRADGRQMATLDLVVAQIDYICQMAGDARHVGLGTDFDGGFGVQSVPVEIDTIADLPKLVPLLSQKGYSDQDITAILGENWLRKLRQSLPEAG